MSTFILKPSTLLNVVFNVFKVLIVLITHRFVSNLGSRVNGIVTKGSGGGGMADVEGQDLLGPVFRYGVSVALVVVLPFPLTPAAPELVGLVTLRRVDLRPLVYVGGAEVDPLVGHPGSRVAGPDEGGWV